MKISLAMIVKSSDIKQATKAIESVKQYVDEVCITIADKSPQQTDSSLLKGYKVSTFEWCDDFAKARAYNFKQCTGDWILWLDADDTLRGAENLKDLVKMAEEQNVKGYAFEYLYAFDKQGKCVDKHWKMQLLKNDGHFEWKGAIHEDPIQQIPTAWTKTNDCVRIHHSGGDRTIESYKRNLVILEKELKSQGDKPDPRTLFYLGRSYIGINENQKAVDYLSRYLTISGWDEERYEARMLIGQCFLIGGQLDEALEMYNMAILEKEEYPDAYINKGMVYMKKEAWKKAEQNFEIALMKQPPDGNTYFNPMIYSHKLPIALATCYMYIGKFKKSVEYAEYAFKVSPDKSATFIYKLTRHIKDKIDTAKIYRDLALKLEELGQVDKIKTLLHSVPSELMDNPYIKGLNRFLPPKIWKEKTLAVYCGNSPEVWTPDSMDKGGIGGSETAVIEICKRLAKKGWHITVYNNSGTPPEGKNFDKVMYKNYWDFNIRDEFNVLWVWRLPEIFDYDIKAKYALLDLHDVTNPLEITDERLKKIDKIFVKTNYHRSLLPNIPDDKFEIIGNGINLDRFKNEVKKEPYRFIYSSTPNRGLDLILESMWDKIKEILPEAELHTYYGFNTFYELEKNNPERMKWMQKMQELMNKDGVINHGRVGQQELADDILKSSFWLYPTYFPEIHCITACEMQAGGVIPITSGYAALAETQKEGLKLEGDVYDPEWQDNYIKEVIKLAKDKKRVKELSIKSKAVAQQFSWGNVAEAWNNKLKICQRK